MTPEPLDAGPFAAWRRTMVSALRGDTEADVPCGDCTACCRAGQFVAIGPDEADALAHIPAELLFPAPRRPPGHVLMGYDEQGRCPMLGDHGCTIYEHRPRTCRTYDCRVFPAAGLRDDDPARAAVAERADRWQFRHPTPVDRHEHDAVRAAAGFLGRNAEEAVGGPVGSPTARAMLAVEAAGAFLAPDGTGHAPTVAEVRVVLRRPRPGAGGGDEGYADDGSGTGGQP